jgi:hypothetical protein
VMGLLALALNSDARVAPDMLHELRCAVSRAVDTEILSIEVHGRLFDRRGKLLPKVELRDELTAMLNDEEEDSEMFLALAPFMCAALDQMFERFPLVRPADAVGATLKAARAFSAAVRAASVVSTATAHAAPAHVAAAAAVPSATMSMSRAGAVAHGSQAAMAARLRLAIGPTPLPAVAVEPAAAAEPVAAAPPAPPFRWCNAAVIQAPDGGDRFHRPVPSPRALAKLLNDAMLANVPETQKHVRMHEAMTAADWRQMIAEVRADAAKLTAFGNRIACALRIVVFVDELNTSNILGMIKEAFVDHACDGVRLPSNVVFFGAVNPNDPDTARRGAATTAANVGVRSATDDEKYVVFEMPLSLKALVVSVASMTPETERLFLNAFLDPTNGALPKELRADDVTVAITDVFKEAVLFSQEFVRGAKLHRLDSSIRDINRAVIFYRFFADTARRQLFMPVDERTLPHDYHWRAVLLALGVVYYLRLPAAPHAAAGEGFRKQYIVRLQERLGMAVDRYRSRDGRSDGDVRGALNDARHRLQFEIVWRDSVQLVFAGTRIPRGIAPTLSLQECIFVCVVCAEACVPCQVVGPPGCGKTLGFQVFAC